MEQLITELNFRCCVSGSYCKRIPWKLNNVNETYKTYRPYCHTYTHYQNGHRILAYVMCFECDRILRIHMDTISKLKKEIP